MKICLKKKCMVYKTIYLYVDCRPKFMREKRNVTFILIYIDSTYFISKLKNFNAFF